MTLESLLLEVWPHVAAAFTVVANCWPPGHAVLRKRDVRAAVAWVGLVWLVPLVGVVLYLLLGINRIRRRARSLTLRQEHGQFPPKPTRGPVHPRAAGAAVPPAEHLASLARLVDEVVHHRPLLPGNRLVPLEAGDGRLPGHAGGHRRGAHLHLAVQLHLRQRRGGPALRGGARAGGEARGAGAGAHRRAGGALRLAAHHRPPAPRRGARGALPAHAASRRACPS